MLKTETISVEKSFSEFFSTKKLFELLAFQKGGPTAPTPSE
jgi:hypothetical protein